MNKNDHMNNKSSEKLKLIAEQYEIIRCELNKQANADEKLSNQKKTLELSEKLDRIHNDYLNEYQAVYQNRFKCNEIQN